jgi:hypothetical protein
MAGNYKHGMRHTRIYNIWRSMRQRCLNPNAINFKNYGGKGISVCDEWNDFTVFAKWAMENGYQDSLTIDRLDVNGNYEPSNCRWATQKAQQNNKTSNRVIEMDGISHTLSEWSAITGVKVATIWARLNSGWSAERTLLEPVTIGKNQYTRR